MDGCGRLLQKCMVPEFRVPVLDWWIGCPLTSLRSSVSRIAMPASTLPTVSDISILMEVRVGSAWEVYLLGIKLMEISVYSMAISTGVLWWT